MANLEEKILIIGAGCFGISTALHLLRRGFTDVTVIDRSSTLPAVDAASNDFNRVVRTSYADPFYSKFAYESITAWRDREEWGDTYQESGIIVLGMSGNEAYTDMAYQNDIALGSKHTLLVTGEEIRAKFPPGVPTASFDKQSGYLNSDSGWAKADQGLARMIPKVTSLGGRVIPGKTVSQLIRDNGKTTGVRCADGTVYEASTIVVATGSWTSSTFPGIASGHTSGLSTGQCIAIVQLTEEEAELYKSCPLVLDFGSGFYVFPPTDKGMVKMAMHLAGYTHTVQGISTPRTIATDPERGLLIPKADADKLREHLRAIYPKLAEKTFSATRLCWYNDSPDGNWIIGRVPNDPSLVLATAGSGHAYKFFPVIGRLVADAIQGTLEPTAAAKFAVDRQYTSTDGSRKGMVTTELVLADLCTPEDLKNNHGPLA